MDYLEAPKLPESETRHEKSLDPSREEVERTTIKKKVQAAKEKFQVLEHKVEERQADYRLALALDSSEEAAKSIAFYPDNPFLSQEYLDASEKLQQARDAMYAAGDNPPAALVEACKKAGEEAEKVWMEKTIEAEKAAREFLLVAVSEAILRKIKPKQKEVFLKTVSELSHKPVTSLRGGGLTIALLQMADPKGMGEPVPQTHNLEERYAYVGATHNTYHVSTIYRALHAMSEKLEERDEDALAELLKDINLEQINTQCLYMSVPPDAL